MFSIRVASAALQFCPHLCWQIPPRLSVNSDALRRAAGGAGDVVHLTGAAHMVFAVARDANGNVHIETHINTVGLSGVGLTTGNKYQASQADSFISNSGGTRNEFTIINNFRMTAPGPGNNVLVHELIHGYIDTNGNVIAVIDNITSDCG